MAAINAIARFITDIEHCLATGNLAAGRRLHAILLKTALNHHTLLANRIVDFYSKCGSFLCAQAAFDDLPFKNHQSFNTLLAALSRAGRIDDARRLFDRIPERNVVSYNTMMSAFARNGEHRCALEVFVEMPKDVVLDKFTVLSVATVCGNLGAMRLLRQLHGKMIVSGMELNVILSNVMIDGYGKCGDADSARCVFDKMAVRDAISWTSLIVVYSGAGRLDEAQYVFDSMPDRNVVSWTALISGYLQNGQEGVALQLFEQMMEEGINPTAFTLVSVLSACASLGLIVRGKEIHGYIFRKYIGLDSFNVFTFNALIAMYSKCGDMRSAMALFERMPEKDLVTWNSIITGFAQNGQGKESLLAFERMLETDIKPSSATFLGVLSGCSHAGLISEGRRILDSMQSEHDTSPRPEHYAAFIDALGRNHQLDEALQFIESLSSASNSASIGAWGAFLGACQVHGNLELAKRAAEILFMLEPDNGVRYVTLSNIYSASGKWDDARRIRITMKGKRLKKDPGYSWIEVKSLKHMFLADDESHPQAEAIYDLLATLVEQMRKPKHPLEDYLPQSVL